MFKLTFAPVELAPTHAERRRARIRRRRWRQAAAEAAVPLTGAETAT